MQVWQSESVPLQKYSYSCNMIDDKHEGRSVYLNAIQQQPAWKKKIKKWVNKIESSSSLLL